MDADQEQLIRHNTQIIGETVALYYEGLRAAGVPKKLARQVAFSMYSQIQAATQLVEVIE